MQENTYKSSLNSKNIRNLIMNKNILYASIAIFLIVGIALTVPKVSKVSKDTSKEVYKVKFPKDKGNNSNDAVENQENNSNDAAEYTERQLNRAKTYQAKSWAKDDTINDAAWKAAQLIDAPSEESAEDSKKPTEEKSETTSTLNTANTQDSKNSAMID